jgi:NAD(P)H dehydrogenase (quinone)
VLQAAAPEVTDHHLPEMTDHLIQHLVAIAADYRNGIFAGVDGVIERVTGQRPLTVGQFVERNIEAFGFAAAG